MAALGPCSCTASSSQAWPLRQRMRSSVSVLSSKSNSPWKAGCALRQLAREVGKERVDRLGGGRQRRGSGGGSRRGSGGGGKLRANDAVVNLTHVSQVPREFGQEILAARARAQRSRGHAPRKRVEFRRIVGGDGVRLTVFLKLQAVFQVPQKDVGRCQAPILDLRKQVLVAQTPQREDRAAVPHPALAPAVQTLQALHEKFDIANAAGGELHVEFSFLLAAFALLQALVNARARDRHGFDLREVRRR